MGPKSLEIFAGDSHGGCARNCVTNGPCFNVCLSSINVGDHINITKCAGAIPVPVTEYASYKSAFFSIVK